MVVLRGETFATTYELSRRKRKEEKRVKGEFTFKVKLYMARNESRLLSLCYSLVFRLPNFSIQKWIKSLVINNKEVLNLVFFLVVITLRKENEIRKPYNN